MPAKVLFVDDDRVLRARIQKMYGLYGDDFQTLVAADGFEASRMLIENTISLVVTDLQMPGMDGFGLLAHLSRNFPDIPVIVVTGHHPSENRKQAIQKGAIGFLEKPFELDRLAELILKMIRKESSGGTLHSISLEMFAQLVEMEMKTCTLRVVNRNGGDAGVLFFKNGELLDARFRGFRGRTAALAILKWEKVTIDLQDECLVKKDHVKAQLQAVVMEAVRMRDDGVDPTRNAPDRDRTSVPPEFDAEKIRQALKALPGNARWLKSVVIDDACDAFIASSSQLGAGLALGHLSGCYVERSETEGVFFLPGERTILVKVDPDCPRDTIAGRLYPAMG
jgi:CheY-like chemotaxis protein